jgi:hypothetical protein
LKNNTKTDTTNPSADREAVRVLAIEIGAREAARKLGLKENTVLCWARREKWNLPKRTGGPKAIELQSKPGDVLIPEHERLEGQTRTGLSRAAATAAEHASGMEGNDVLGHSSQLRNITMVATKVFGWDKKEKPDVQVNQLVISPDAAEGLVEMNGLLKEGGEINAERWTQLNHRIQAGTTGRVTAEQLEGIREAAAARAEHRCSQPRRAKSSVLVDYGKTGRA